MASGLFECAAEWLEKRTSLERLEARGTLRLALKTAGLEPATLTLDQLRVVFETLMDEIARSPAAQSAPADSGADEVFRRLGGD